MLKKTNTCLLLLMGLLVSFTVQAKTIDELFHKRSDPAIGNPKGDITIVEFFDYQCSHCMNMAYIIDAISKTNPNVRIVFKDFPIRGPISEFGARAALAAKNQHKYYKFSHALLTSNQTLTENVIISIAKNLGLDTAKLKRDIHSRSITEQLNENIKLAQMLKLAGTPAFYFGKTRDTRHFNYVLGEMSQEEMQESINKASLE